MMKLLLARYLLAIFLPTVATYSIEYCGISKPAIEFVVTLAQTSMIQPLYDLQHGISSTHGYNAMFKLNIFRPYIHNLMTSILHLGTVQAAGRDQEPTFVCAKPNMEGRFHLDYDPLQRCADTQATSFWAEDTALIFLCPSFSDLAVQPPVSPAGPKDIYCPVVLNNVFVGQSDPLVRYQNYNLVYELAHLYLQRAGLTVETVPKEVMDWNDCVGLGWAPIEGGLSVKNPFNLVYYVACEFRCVEGGN